MSLPDREEIAEILYSTWTRPQPGVIALHDEGPAPLWEKAPKSSWYEMADALQARLRPAWERMELMVRIAYPRAQDDIVCPESNHAINPRLGPVEGVICPTHKGTNCLVQGEVYRLKRDYQKRVDLWADEHNTLWERALAAERDAGERAANEYLKNEQIDALRADLEQCRSLARQLAKLA